MKKFVDKYKGKIGFVLGSGPSLRNLDPESIENHIVIAVNDAILKMPSAEFFVCCDWGIPLRKAWLTVKKSKCSLILHNVDVGYEYLDNRTGVKAFDGLLLERVSYFDYKENDNFTMEKESGKLIRGSSSIHPAVHFAHLLGCSLIVLLGCDCLYEEDKYRYTDFSDQPIGGYIRPEYEKIKPPYCFPVARFGNSDAILKGHVTCWKKIRRQNPDINIIDTSGGDLTMFPQISLKEVLEQYGRP